MSLILLFAPFQELRHGDVVMTVPCLHLVSAQPESAFLQRGAHPGFVQREIP